MPKVRPALVLVSLAVVILSAVPGPRLPTATVLRSGTWTLAGAATDTAAPSVAIDPSSWWMESGTNVTLVASWTGIPPGCGFAPEWYRWSLAPGGSEGVLNGTNGSATVFMAANPDSGTTAVTVRTAGALRCGGNATAAFATAVANVTVAAPLRSFDLEIEPNPIAPGGTANLTGLLAGGTPPYNLSVAWGDGNRSVVSASAPGPFVVGHAYGSAGTYDPQLLVVDSAGATASGRPSEPAIVSSTFAAAIVPSVPVAEVGVPVTFDIRTLDSPPAFSAGFACPDAVPWGTDNGTGLVYGCSFEGPGNASVSFEAVGGSSPYAEATASLVEPVVPPPALRLLAPPRSAEVGETVYAPIELAGGVPPFRVSWSVVGAASAGTVSVPADGTAYLPLDSDRAGTLELSVVAEDALGQSDATGSEGIPFVPELEVTAAAAGGPANGSAVLNVTAGVVDGAPPFDWIVAPGVAPENASPDAGVLTGDGDVAWNASYRAEGPVAVTVAVVDADGVAETVNLTTALLPVLTVRATASPAGVGTVELQATIAGGEPPYAYRWNDSAGDRWNGTQSSDGTFVLDEAIGGSGPCTFDLVVVDAFGANVTTEARASLAAPPARPAADLAGGAVALAAILVAVVAGWLLWRWRRPARPAPPEPDPVGVLREIIEPCDGVDLGMVEMLAEERGLTPEAVRRTLARLKADGSVRAGRGSDGEEVLAWTGPLPP